MDVDAYTANCRCAFQKALYQAEHLPSTVIPCNQENKYKSNINNSTAH
jgi:hypothetical protein